MADEAEEVVEEPGGGGRSGGSTPIMILLVLVCLLMGANLYFTITKKSGPAAAEQAEGEVPEKAIPWKPSEDFEALYSTKDNGVVQVQMTFEVATAQVAELLTAEEAQIQDEILQIFLRKNLDDIDADSLKEEIQSFLDGLIGVDDQIKSIYLVKFRKQPMPG